MVGAARSLCSRYRHTGSGGRAVPNPEHVKIVRQGAEAIRQWQEDNPATRFDLEKAGRGAIDQG